MGDQLSTSFLIPRKSSGVNYAEIFEVYLHGIKERLGVRTGRVWYTGRHDIYVNIPMGKNYITKIPHEISERLGNDNVEDYTFHSFRRTAATNIADQGATALQMQQHFGWKIASMAMEYISKSKVHVDDCGEKLAGGGDSSGPSTIQSVSGPSDARHSTLSSISIFFTIYSTVLCLHRSDSLSVRPVWTRDFTGVEPNCIVSAPRLTGCHPGILQGGEREEEDEEG